MKQQENNMKTLTAKAWITNPEWADESDLENPSMMHFTSTTLDMKTEGWLEVGTATITIESTLTKKDLVLSMVETQEAKIKKIQADAENEINNLRRKIMDLKAIAYEA
jgi:hypothetical protein